jgi:hypothetical protein
MAFAVFALKLAPIPCDGDRRIATAQVLAADHAWQVKGDLCSVVCPSCSKRLVKETLIIRIH